MGEKVSIILPVYNAEQTLERTVDSCLNQTYSNFELIIVLNGSNSNTQRIATLLEKEDKRIKIVESPVKGRSVARNIGLKYATGKYIQFLDADDSLDKDKLKVSIDFLGNNTMYYAYCTDISYFDESSNSIILNRKVKNDKSKLLYENIFPINSVIFRNINVISFRDYLEYDEDWLFWIENLFYKNIKIDNSFNGGTVYVTGKNTMNDFNSMFYYFIYVRSLIRKEYRDHKILRKVKRDLSLMHNYVSLNNIDAFPFNNVIEKNFGIYFKLSNIYSKLSFHESTGLKKVKNQSDEVYHK